MLAFLFSFFWIIPYQIPAPSLYICCPMWGNRRQSCILDSTPRILDSKYWISDLFGGLRFQIPVVREMPNSYSCIPDSKAQDSGFHKQKISKIPDTTGKKSELLLKLRIQCTESKIPQLSTDRSAIYGTVSFECNKFSIWIF